ncbi:Pyruvate/Phosphoenolpyruvate kinase-like domain-containing protein [Mycena latifolia]|nr:Pyruvate/Phosphoenolpyruvate kinase-like domain-containing protein [Mycena latifolia]
MSASPKFTLDAKSRAEYRPTTLQQPSNLQALFKSGKAAIGMTLSYPSAHVAKTIAVTGGDWCWIDAEHVAWSQTLLVECIQIIIHESGGTMIPVVRVPSKTAFDYMAWCLDAGAGGLIIPHVDTVDEMKAIIAACRFPPMGHRSFPPFTYLPGVTDITPEGETLFTIANKSIALVPQIESRRGMENLDEIMTLDEVSGFMIGTGDLRIDMGLPLAFDGDEPEFVAAMQKATRVSTERNIPIVGVTLSPAMVKKRINEGYRILLCAFDVHVLAFGMIKMLGEAKVAAEEQMQAIHINGLDS